MSRKELDSKTKPEPKVRLLRRPTDNEVDHAIYAIKWWLGRSVYWCFGIGIGFSWIGITGFVWYLVMVPMILYLLVLVTERLIKLIRRVNGRASQTVAPNARQIELRALERNDSKRLVITAIVIVVIIAAFSMLSDVKS